MDYQEKKPRKLDNKLQPLESQKNQFGSPNSVNRKGPMIIINENEPDPLSSSDFKAMPKTSHYTPGKGHGRKVSKIMVSEKSRHSSVVNPRATDRSSILESRDDQSYMTTRSNFGNGLQRLPKLPSKNEFMNQISNTGSTRELVQVLNNRASLR